MPQSPELAAGTGFTFENLVAAKYLAGLLTETAAPGQGGIVSAVALQQRDFGEPLDDIIVDFRFVSGALARLSLQCKKSLTISAAASNQDFREIVRDSLQTLQREGFRDSKDRFGAAVMSIATGSFDTLNALCELARHSDSVTHFQARFAPEGNASGDQRTMRDVIATLLSELLGENYSNDVQFRFLRHFVLVRFDYLHEGAADHAEGINAVRPALPVNEHQQAPLLWATLCGIAREGAGRSARFSRPDLVVRLDRSIRLIGAPSLRTDLAKVAELTGQWLLDIDDDVRGTRLERARHIAELGGLLEGSRFVQIRGLPGSGKSVLLRRRIEQERERGPILFLKSDRLEGRSWAAFATTMGLATTTIAELLVEIAACGSATLYVDGIDRIEKDHQGVITDLVRAILCDPLLSSWKIVVSLRDAGSEPVRTWLPDLFEKGGLSTIDVQLLDDSEAQILAADHPELMRLLFGAEAVRQIVRRPFFAKILSQALLATGAPNAFAPASEVDLLENWWARGGFDSSGSEAIIRQRAIVELAAVRSRDLSRPIALGDLTPQTIGVINDLITDGILQFSRKGHSVRFSHDIFFEWALFHRLVSSGSSWIDELRTVGEPPVVGRVVELLSQADFEAERDWPETLAKLENANLRSQWTRAWLLGPLSAPTFDPSLERYYVVCAANEFRLLRKALVWFQAEKTIPNANILNGQLGSPDLKRHEIVRLADTMGWPSDLASWKRLLLLVFTHMQDLPRSIIPDAVVIFEVWQNAVGAVPNRMSSLILGQCSAWLDEIERHRHSWRGFREARLPSPWDSFEADLEDLEDALRVIVLRGASVRPDLVSQYFDTLLADKNRLDNVFKHIAAFSPILTTTHAAKLVELSLLHLKDELPQARFDRHNEERRQGDARRKAARDKPAGQRTKEDEMVLSGPFSMSILGSSIGYGDWDDLAIGRHAGDYFPASPLREPFHALFESAPTEALRLVKELSNHAVTAWRQLHRLDADRRSTPVPIELEFPWGSQQFWGNNQEYLYSRGIWGPKPLAGAYLALESWALKEIDAGKPVDDILREVVEGNTSVAALGVAVAIFLKTGATIPATLPLVVNPRIWKYDLSRMVEESSFRTSSQIGFNHRSDRQHALAVEALNQLPFRRYWIRDHLTMFLMQAGQDLANRARLAIAAFPQNLPFAYEEEKSDQSRVAEYEKDAIFNAEFAKPENLQITPDPNNANQALVIIDNPLTQDPAMQAKLAEGQERQLEHLMWFWSHQSLDGTTISEARKPGDAVAFAKRFDTEILFQGAAESAFEDSVRRGAVAGIAAVVLKYRDQFDYEDISWARTVITRAAEMAELSGDLWSNHAQISWHHAISAAKGLAAEIRFAPENLEAKRALLRLIGHPLDQVSLTALACAQQFWDIDARLAWCALWEAVAISIYQIQLNRGGQRVFEADYIASKRREHVTAGLALFERPDHWPELPRLPPAWELTPDSSRRSQVGDISTDFADDSRRWRQPHRGLDWNFAAKALNQLSVVDILANKNSRAKFSVFVIELRQWVIERLFPPWKKRGRRERSENVGELDNAVGRLFAKMAMEVPTADIKEIFLDPVFGLEDEICYELLSPFVRLYVCMAVYDPVTIPSNAVEVLQLALARMLRDPSFSPSTFRDGKLYGHHLYGMVRAFFFVSADRAPGSSRFANENWSEIGIVMPLIDTLVRAAGRSADVMSDYLTLLERSQAHYPAEIFADQMLFVLAAGRNSLKGWHGTILPARIAGLVQAIAFRETPMRAELAQKLLRILDILVDMGDRRSAALQISDSFREVRAPAGS